MKQDHFGTCFQDTVNSAEMPAKGIRLLRRGFISYLLILFPVAVIGGTAFLGIACGYTGEVGMGFGPSGAFLDLKGDSSDSRACLEADSKVE